MVLNAAFQATQRPAAVLLPIMGWALSFRSIAMLLDVSVLCLKEANPGTHGSCV
jgi:hypothetical protein